MPDGIFDELVKRAVEKEPLPDPPPTVAQQGPEQPPVSSKAAHLAWLGGNAADWITTAIASHKGAHEANPLLKWAGDKGAIPAGIGSEIGMYLLARKLAKKDHPKIFNAMLYAMGGAHGLAGAHNMGVIKDQNQMIAAKDQPEQPPFPGAVKQPDGSWIDPHYFGGDK